MIERPATPSGTLPYDTASKALSCYERLPAYLPEWAITPAFPHDRGFFMTSERLF